MKKVLSVVAVVAMLFALSVSAFADEAVPSVENNGNSGVTTYVDSPSYAVAGEDISTETETVELANGETATVELSAAEALTSEQKSSLKAEMADNEAAAEVVDVDLVDKDGNSVSSENFPEGGVTVVFVRNDDAKVVKVLYWNSENSAWDEATGISQNGNKVTATFGHFCTVAFLTAVESDDNTDGNNGASDEPNTNGDNTNGGNTNGGNTNGGNGIKPSDIKPSNNGSNQPADADDNQTANAGDNQPADADDNQPADADDNQPADADDNQPANAGDNQPSGTTGGIVNTSNNTGVKPSGSQSSGSAKGGTTSPQTGYNTAIWAAVAVVLVLAAGVCFVSARKKVTE